MEEQTLVLSADSLRWDHLGQYGYHRNTMPALDILVEEGRAFKAALANGAHTRTSVPSILTGRYDGFAVLNDRTAFPALLSGENIRTCAVHSNAHLTSLYGQGFGFSTFECFDKGKDEWTVAPSYQTGTLKRFHRGLLDLVPGGLKDIKTVRRIYHNLLPDRLGHVETPYVDAETVTDYVLDWVSRNKDRDFVLWAHYMDPHRPYGIADGSERYLNKSFSREEILDLMATAGVQPETVDETDRETMINLYDSDLRYLSGELLRLFEGLASMGVWEDANVIFTSDHGDEFGEHGRYFHRNLPYEELIRVPLLYRRGGNQVEESGTRELVDLVPTLLNLHNAALSDSLDGVSLHEPAEAPAVSTRVNKDSEVDIAVREMPWKYIAIRSGEDELYNLTSDPGEQENLTDSCQSVAKRLRRHVPMSLRDSSANKRSDDIADDAKRRLEDLGYLE